MQADFFQQVEQAFTQALLALDGGLALNLPALCGDNPAVVTEVQALLRSHEAINAPAPSKTDSKPGFLNPAELHPWRYQGESPTPLLADWDASALGQRVGDFTLIGELGAGGMGKVFRAQQDKPRRAVALKLIRRQVATPTMIRRFEHEIELLGKLNHPAITHIYAAGLADLLTQTASLRVPYIAMELVEGETISSYVHRKCPDAKKPNARAAVALPLMIQLCEAMQHAHTRGVIHRDLKPANVLVTFIDDKPCIKVLDFGIARTADFETTLFAAELHDARADNNLTAAHHVLGTLAYMSPEQVRSSTQIDARSDVYSICAMLYELLSGRPPIEVENTPLDRAMERILRENPAPLPIPRSLFSFAFHRPLVQLEQVIRKGLAKQAEGRFASAAELAGALRPLHFRS